MGLDMYLHKKTYVKNWDFMKDSEKHDVTVMQNGKICEDIKKERISYIIEEVAYWRKANQIHKWFVDNTQGGKDECRESYVMKSQLETLLNLCRECLEYPHKAPKLLPTEEGFFFGSTAYDEFYFRDLKETEKMLSELLKEESHDGFFYSASW